MDTRSEDTIVHQIEKNLSNHMNDSLFLNGRTADNSRAATENSRLPMNHTMTVYQPEKADQEKMHTALLFLITLLAYFVKGITGFGNTLVMGSLFSFLVSNRLTTPVDLLLSIPTNAYIVWRERKNISWKVVVPLSLMLLAGIIPGTFLLKFGSDWILKSALGIVVIGMALEMLTRKPAKEGDKKTNPIFLTIIGILSGMLAGLYGIGALLVAYISRTTDNKNQFRANICCVFLVDNIFRFFFYLYTGILNKEVLHMTLLLIPAVILGMMIGIKADSRMKEATVKKSVIALLIISGTVLLLKSILGQI